MPDTFLSGMIFGAGAVVGASILTACLFGITAALDAFAWRKIPEDRWYD